MKSSNFWANSEIRAELASKFIGSRTHDLGGCMEPRFKRLVITCIPGADFDPDFKKSFGTALKENLEQQGVNVENFSVRDLIYRFAEEEDVALAARVIHRASDEKVRLLRRLAFLELEKQLTVSVPTSVAVI